MPDQLADVPAILKALRGIEGPTLPNVNFAANSTYQAIPELSGSISIPFGDASVSARGYYQPDKFMPTYGGALSLKKQF